MTHANRLAWCEVINLLLWHLFQWTHVLLGNRAEGTEQWMVLQTAESVEDTAVADCGPPNADGAIPQRFAGWAACLGAPLCFSLNELVWLKELK